MSRRGMVIGVLLAGVLGLTGCESGSEKREQEMLAHMYEKYGVEFQVDDSAETVYADSYDSWNCSLKGNTDPEQKGIIEVHKWKNEEGDLYTDTYFPILIREEIEDRICESLDETLDTYKVYVRSFDHYVDNKYNAVEQLDAYLEEIGNECADYSVQIMILARENEQENEEVVQNVLKMLVSTNVGNPYANILCVNEDVLRDSTESNSEQIWKIENNYHYEGRIY